MGRGMGRSAPFQTPKKWVRIADCCRLNPQERNLSDIPLLSIDETLQRMSGDRELLVNLFQLYIDDAPKKLRGIEEYAGAGEFYQIERTAHSLKGASATVGAARLCGLAADLEQAAKAGSQDRIDALRAELSRVCDQTLESMRRFCAG